jgi:metal-responsive CopG/Arc/MetJ family transcriptional regulator
MSEVKIKIDKELFRRAEKIAGAAGYSSADEFIAHLIEKEVSKFEDTASEEELKNRLKGLGYIS